MNYALANDNRQGSLTFGKEIVIPLTTLETPPMLACALRAYTKTYEGLQTFGEAWMEKPPKEFERIISVPEKFATEESLKKIESSLDKIAELRLVMATQPRLAKRRKKAPDLVEVKVGGGEIKERFEYAKKLLGTEVKVTDFVKEGQAVDAIGVTLGNPTKVPQSPQNSPPSRHNRRMDPPLRHVLSSPCRTDGFPPTNRIQQISDQARQQWSRSHTQRRIPPLWGN
jgi:large subunit ribosomal protein L3